MAKQTGDAALRFAQAKRALSAIGHARTRLMVFGHQDHQTTRALKHVPIGAYPTLLSQCGVACLPISCGYDVTAIQCSRPNESHSSPRADQSA